MNIVKKLKIKVVNLVPLKIVSYLSQLCSLILKGNSSIEDEASVDEIIELSSTESQEIDHPLRPLSTAVVVVS